MSRRISTRLRSRSTASRTSRVRDKETVILGEARANCTIEKRQE